MFPLFETIRMVDGEPQLLTHHQARMERSTWELFGRCSKLILADEIAAPVDFRVGIVKLKICYNDHTAIQEYAPYNKRVIKTLKMVHADDITYAMKKTDRSRLNKLWSLRGSCDDILIIKNGMATDTSYTNILFLEGDDWITPDTPLLKGTQRAHLIDHGEIAEIPVSLRELRRFRGFQLINAMMPFDPGRIESMKGLQV